MSMTAAIATTRHGACPSCTLSDNQIVWHDGPCPHSSADGAFPSPSAVLDLVELCTRCSLPGRPEVHCGTVCPESGVEHSSRGAMRDRQTRCLCGKRTWNWSARCDECKRGGL